MEKPVFKAILSVLLLCIFLTSCAFEGTFTKFPDNRITSPDGTEYVFLANEGFVCHFGETSFLGRIKGEKASFQHLSTKIKTGMFSLANDPQKNILIRHAPDSEWISYYRKASLPELDLSPMNCIRLEFVAKNDSTDIQHLNCGKGITDQSIIKEFIQETEEGQTAKKAGLYDLITKSDGTLENCYILGTVYGFFKDENNLAVPLIITSFNDRAYSITIENSEMVLPEKWYTALLEASK